MRRHHRTFRMALAVVIGAAVTAPGAMAQDKVIKKTTDASGFEKQLTEIDLMHQTAAQLMSAGQWDQAAAELEKVVANEADRVEAWQDLAKCYNKLEQYDKAAAAYMSAHKINPGSLDLLSNLGFAQLRAQQLEPAMETYETMLKLDALSHDANVHLGFIYQKKGDAEKKSGGADAGMLHEKAIGYYEKALEGKPDDVQSMGSLAALYADAGRGDDSILMYERAIAAASDDQKIQLRSKLGSSLITDKKFDKAAEVYGALVEASPDNPAHRFNLAICLMQVKKHKEAAPHMEKVIELKPDYAAAYQQLGAIYNETGKYNQAVATVKKGLAVTDDKAGLYCTWGRSLEKMELYDEAMEIFQRATGDPQWGGYARKQIQRQEDLKKRAKMMSGG